MIAVIADDFTGAAELAGIGLRYGLKVDLWTRPAGTTDADLLVVCTDSRSLNKEEAVRITAEVVTVINALQPDWIYKKIDSVFRGHVLAESEVQMQLSGLKKAVILGANPSLGRTIREGNYYVNGQPVHEAGFAADPEFPVKDPSVLSMLRADADEVQVLKPGTELQEEGIVIAAAETPAEVAAWAGQVDEQAVLVGAGDFFTALLDKNYGIRRGEQPGLQLPFLYVCGTAFHKSHAFVRQVNRTHNNVVYLSFSVLQGEAESSWLQQAMEKLDQQQKLIIAIDPDEKGIKQITPVTLRTRMAEVVKKLIQAAGIRELFIEGGATASAVLQALDLHTFRPEQELLRGVTRMKAGKTDIHITVKPGSYELPEQISALFH